MPNDDHATAADRRQELMALLAPIHDRAQRSARRLCRSDADGDDLFQDTVLQAYRRVGGLRDPAAFPAWFYRIMLNQHRTRSRRGFWRRLVALDDAGERDVAFAGDDGAAWEAARHSAERMRRALATLPADQREAIVLFEIDGYTLEEVADLQGVGLSAVKSRLSRARARLRRHYDGLAAAERAAAERAGSTLAREEGAR
jgi:RNA polymerase sigma-70 factor (ECF subfamily)